MANYDSTHTGATIDSAVSQVTDSTTDLNIDSNTLVVDKSANSVGIGIAAPASALHIAGTMQVGADGSGQDVIFYSGTAGDNFTWDASEECLIITGTDAAQALKVADGDLVVVDKIYLYDNDGGEYLSSDGTDLTITSGNDIVLSPTGNVGIGTANPLARLEVAATAANANVIAMDILNDDEGATGETGQSVEFNFNTMGTNDSGSSYTSTPMAGFVAGRESDYFTASGFVDYNGYLAFKTANGGSHGEKMRIDSSGDVTFTGDLIMADGKGIDFSADASPAAGMTAETLTDYEEGTWTPAFALATAGDSSWTHDRQVASYIKIGNICTFQCFLRTDAYSNSTGSGQLRITGLPFASDSTSNRITAVSVSAFDFAADNNPINGVVMADVQYITLYKRADANDGDTTLDENSSVNGANKNTIYVAGSYRTA